MRTTQALPSFHLPIRPGQTVANRKHVFGYWFRNTVYRMHWMRDGEAYEMELTFSEQEMCDHRDYVAQRLREARGYHRR